MKKKILILIGKPIGLKVVNFLKKYSKFDIEVCTNNKDLVKNKSTKFVKTKKNFIDLFKKTNAKYDFLVLVYWPWLVPNNLFIKFKDSINFHPAYLPIGRGWYPHAHAIISNLKWGVTLHKILPGIDDGDIWCQKEIKYNFFSNSKNLYKRSEDTLLKLFKDNALKIIDGKVKAKKQKGKSITFFKKDLLKYDKLILNKKYRLDKLIKISNARSFGKKIFNYFYYKNQKYSFNIKIKKID